MNTTTDTDAWKALLMNPRLSVIRPLATNDRRYGFTVDVSYLPDGTKSSSRPRMTVARSRLSSGPSVRPSSATAG